MLTLYGNPFEVVYEVNPSWSEDDKNAAMAQLSDFGRIYIDVLYKRPVTNEYELKEIHNTVELL